MDSENPYASPALPASASREVPRLEPPQSVSFQLTEEELLATANHINNSNIVLQRFVRRRQRGLLMVAFVVAAIALGLAVIDSIYSPFVWINLALAVGLGIGAFRLRRNVQRANNRIGREMLENEAGGILDRKNRATLFDEGFELADQDGHSFRKWSSVAKVERIEQLLLIYVVASAAHCIPSRAFFDDPAFEGYCNLAERLWREAHPEALDDMETTNAG
ncbi:YcxB family protein [Aeoliella sp. ICT_H6.2]|uniref:YcxB family protein n=1 Tax=Aeoliella straminimaris TaxID=2954799 RepID=A0A9X2FEZ7_9BACT|nr:YcxB family protein [Aeoliella straminimaris]MCO6047013.1 YcxB family protein [Aeoliella straminimaris]